jgi:hypothetical protein
LRGGLTGHGSSDLAEDVTAGRTARSRNVTALIDPIMPQDNFWYMPSPCDQGTNRKSTLLWAMENDTPAEETWPDASKSDSLQHQQPLLHEPRAYNIRMWIVGMYLGARSSTKLRPTNGIDTKSSMSSINRSHRGRRCLPDFVPTRPHLRRWMRKGCDHL